MTFLFFHYFAAIVIVVTAAVLMIDLRGIVIWSMNVQRDELHVNVCTLGLNIPLVSYKLLFPVCGPVVGMWRRN